MESYPCMKDSAYIFYKEKPLIKCVIFVILSYLRRYFHCDLIREDVKLSRHLGRKDPKFATHLRTSEEK